MATQPTSKRQKVSSWPKMTESEKRERIDRIKDVTCLPHHDHDPQCVHDFETALAALHHSCAYRNEAAKRAAEMISGELRENYELFWTSVQINGESLQYASDKLRGDHDIVLAAVQQHCCALRFASDELRGNEEIVIAAVQQPLMAFLDMLAGDDFILSVASEEMKNNRKVVMAAVKNEGCALQFASDHLKGDRDVVLTAIKRDTFGDTLRYASDELKSDRDLMLAAVRKHGRNLSYCSEELKDDSEVVLAAVQYRGFALQFASDHMKGDREVVLTAIKNETFADALQYASDELKSDRDLVIAAVRKHGPNLSFCSDELKDDYEVVLAAVEQNGSALEFASNRLKGENEVVVADELKGTPEIVLAAVKSSHQALFHASDAAWSNLEILTSTVNSYVRDTEGGWYGLDIMDIWRDVRATSVRERVAAIQLPEPSSQFDEALSPQDFAFVWLLNERLKIRYTKAGLRETFPNSIVQCIIEGTSWTENSVAATELGRFSTIIQALATNARQPWPTWLRNETMGEFSGSTGQDEYPETDNNQG